MRSHNYCVDAAKARRLLERMVAAGEVALDIETAPNPSEIVRVTELTREKEAAVGKLKALRKLKAPAAEIAEIVALRKSLDAAIKVAKRAGLDPRRARIRLLQVYDGCGQVLVIDLDRTGAGVLSALEGAHVLCHNVAFEMSFLEHANIALGEAQCTLQACRLTLGEKLTSLADTAAVYLNVSREQDRANQRLGGGASHASAARLCGARRCPRVGDGGARLCSAARPDVGLQYPDSGRRRGDAHAGPWIQVRYRSARPADRGTEARAPGRGARIPRSLPQG